MVLAAANVVLALALALLILAEWKDPAFRHGWRSDPTRLRRNLAFLGASVLVMAFLQALSRWIEPAIPSLRGWHAPWHVELILCFLLAELMGWTLHYIKHWNPFLWMFHFQHHRESQYNLWLSAHTHALEVVISGLLTAFLLGLAGFPHEIVGIYLAFYTFVKMYQHSSHWLTLGPLDRVIVGPRYHRLHHEVDSRCNYAIGLTIFDVLFQTARWPSTSVTEPTYGVSENQGLPFGFWAEMIHFARPSLRHVSSGELSPSETHR